MSFRNRVASSARKTALALALASVVTAANPPAAAEPFGSRSPDAEWLSPWTLIWNWFAGGHFGAPAATSPERAFLTDAPPPPPPPPPPPIDNQTGSGGAGGSGASADPNGRI